MSHSNAPAALAFTAVVVLMSLLLALAFSLQPHSHTRMLYTISLCLPLLVIAWYTSNKVGVIDTNDTINFAYSNGGLKPLIDIVLAYNSNQTDISSALYVPLNNYSLQLNSSYQNLWAWSWSSLCAVVVRSNYTTAAGYDLQRVNKTLNLVHWLYTTDALSAASNYSGIARISDTSWATATTTALTLVQCNGSPCLVTLPTVWVMSNIVVMVGIVSGAAGTAACLFVAAVVLRNRKQAVIRSASVTFMLISLLGLSLQFSAAIALVAAVNNSSCIALAWLVDFGFQLLLLSVVLKLYRIDRIYSRKQLRVIKLADSRLLLYGLPFMVFDVIVMMLWTIDSNSSMLQPTVTNMYMGVNNFKYIQCGVPATTAAAIYPTLVSAEKALFLLYGCYLSFRTRSVSATFAESKLVVLAVYQVMLSILVCIPISLFTHAVGNAAIMLQLILLLWTAIAVLCILFGSKLFTLWRSQSSNSNGNFVSQPENSVTQPVSGFSFINVDLLTASNIESYFVALEAHVNSVKQKRLSYRTITGTPSDYSKDVIQQQQQPLASPRASGARPATGLLLLANTKFASVAPAPLITSLSTVNHFYLPRMSITTPHAQSPRHSSRDSHMLAMQATSQQQLQQQQQNQHQQQQ